MDDEASPEPSTASVEAAPEPAPEALPEPPAGDSHHADRHGSDTPLDRRLRRLAGRKAPYRGPIVAITRGWVSRDARWHVFAARFLDFAVLTPEHLVLCSTGFFSRRPRRQVLREPLNRLIVTPIGEEPTHAIRVIGDFSRPIRIELRANDESTTFIRELTERTPADPRERAEPWASIGQLGLDAVPGPVDTEPAGTEPAGAETPDEHTASS